MKTFESILTNLSEGGDEDPEGDDEWDLNPLELDVENVVLWGASMTLLQSLSNAKLTNHLSLPANAPESTIDFKMRSEYSNNPKIN